MTPHLGPVLVRPVPAETTVQIDIGDGRVYVDKALHFAWGHGAGPNGEGRIYAFKVLQPTARGATQ